MTGPPPIECRSLGRRYGDLLAVDGLELSVPAGSATGFLGPNGAGKTTTLNMFVGLVRPTVGDARLFGIPSIEPAARSRIGFLPEEPAFYPGLTRIENLELLAELDGVRASPDRAWALEILGVSRDDLRRRVGSYSAGTVRKRGLVQPAQHRPDLVIL